MSWERMGLSKAKGGMGFRDLAMFNKALLAKQLWRILQNPNSLVARIMQAKYFPQTTLWEAGPGSRPSLAWRSLLSAREILQKGAIWRVGDGKDIRVWGDCWLPCLHQQHSRCNRRGMGGGKIHGYMILLKLLRSIGIVPS